MKPRLKQLVIRSKAQQAEKRRLRGKENKERENLIKKLKAKGIKVQHNTGLKKLREEWEVAKGN